MKRNATKSINFPLLIFWPLSFLVVYFDFYRPLSLSPSLCVCVSPSFEITSMANDLP